MRTLFSFLLLASCACAQTIRVDRLDDPQPLTGEWRQKVGDDARWADTAFDDSSWTVVTMPRAATAGARGYTWHRIHLELPPASTPCVLIGPRFPAYELFANGQKIGQFGGALGDLLGQYFARPAVFRLSPTTTVLAIRSYDRNIPLGYQASNAERSQSWVGSCAALADRQAAWELDRLRNTQPMRLMSWTLLLGCGFFLAMPVWRRNNPENLWFGLFLGMVVLVRTFQFIPDVTGIQSRALVYFSYNLSAIPVTMVFWPRFMETLFGVRRSTMSWVGIAVVLTLLVLANVGVAADLWPALQAGVVLGAWFLLNLNQGVVYLDVSRGQFAREKGMLPVHAALMLYLGTSLIFYAAPFFTAGKPLGMGSDTPPSIDVVLRAPVLLFMFAMGILLNQRAAFVEQEQGRLKQEMAAAAQVQALLLPSREIPGIEAVYLPASEVGGDFYQILDRDDGSRVIVVGDVSGKGLKAAMLVSAVVGALRQSTASSPAAILADLNRVLAGRAGGGFVTCVCARWHNGEVAIANAGHPAPYINGEEHAGEPGLPLGLVEEAVYQETVLPAPSVLTFVSDGVVEATNAEGQLFGFDRTRVLSVKPAVSLAEAARAWGQNDDITVVTVRSLS